jgi:ribosomal protein S12 methylthiotransferase accessory factor
VTTPAPHLAPELTLHDLAGPLNGLFGAEHSLQSRIDEPQATTRITNLGDLGYVWPHIPKLALDPYHNAAVAGVGGGLEEEVRIVRSRAEALERYCACVYSEDQFIEASANELGGQAIDLEIIPRCSVVELSHPRCPLVAPNKGARIRWVKGVSLLTGRLGYIPAVMVYLYAGFLNRDERICLPITTGCATHNSLERALISGILEVIERDAIALTWLQKLSLPRIEFEKFPPELAKHWEAYQSCSRELKYLFFDATLDLGIPTVYGLQVSGARGRFAVHVSCSASLDPIAAVAKVTSDMAASREAFRIPRRSPNRPEECEHLFDGASFMLQHGTEDAFGFLLDGAKRKKLSGLTGISGPDTEALKVILDRLRARSLEVYAVELSTDEALRAGMRAVRIIVPGLQPFSFHHRARYLGHPRLYDAPKRIGYPVLSEPDLNPWPQPFA